MKVINRQPLSARLSGMVNNLLTSSIIGENRHLEHCY